MELSVRVEELVHRVATRSSTKNQTLEKKDRRTRSRTRQSRLHDLDRSSSNQSSDPECAQPKVTAKKRVEENRITEDISVEFREEIEGFKSTSQPCPRKVKFDEVPVIIESKKKLDEYDIIQDIKDQKANVTI